MIDDHGVYSSPDDDSGIGDGLHDRIGHSILELDLLNDEVQLTPVDVEDEGTSLENQVAVEIQQKKMILEIVWICRFVLWMLHFASRI
jgi:hypothetical protein